MQLLSLMPPLCQICKCPVLCTDLCTCMQRRYTSSCTYPHNNPNLKLTLAPDPSYSVPIFTEGEELSDAL